MNLLKSYKRSARNMNFDPVGKWVAANIRCDVDESPVTRDEVLGICMKLRSGKPKLEYRISGSVEDFGEESTRFSFRCNPQTGAQHKVTTYANGESRESFDTPKLTSEGWFESDQFIIRPRGAPGLMVMWKDFVMHELYSPPPPNGFSMTMHNLRYLKITQDLTDEDAGWGLFVDLETDCALYYCQYVEEHTMFKETVVSSVHVLFSGETSFHEFERNDVGELTRVDSSALEDGHDGDPS
ncbi:hypothetical protein [Corynebacterium glutamicum]|uniref:hypothetical protein n=1 Tax=Corynebacterium glutamicum TaxID=1718 RepID=UPI001E39F7F9|nr:hypothetical protein [Corynebacterium glutamicum]NII99440.1 hypothetical protein [Corynebacterium glutamicum]WBG73622.1 hypothetical protein O5J82_09535 [Corynebacterium glutamicum]